MIWLRRLRSMCTWLFRRSAVERRLNDELQTFVEMSAASRIHDGMPPAEARRLALLELGGLEQAKERVRTDRHGASVDEVAQNVRYGLRALARSPGFTAVVVLTLAFGIGANTAIFSIIDSLLLRPLPVREPSQLALLTNEEPDGGQESWTYPIFEQIRERRTAFGGIAAWATADTAFNLAQGGEMNIVSGLWVSGELFDVLGVPAALGRMLSPADDVRGGGVNGPVAVISHGFWQRHFGGAPDVVGRTLTLERIAFTVVGVTPPGFAGLNVGRAFDVALPFGAEPLVRGVKDSRLDQWGSWWVSILVRLKAEQTVGQATAELRRFQPAIRDATQTPGVNALERDDYLQEPFVLDPDAASQSSLRSQYREPLTVMLVVVGLVLLIACANIANLLQARASARRHEWSLRLALGASRARLARQALTESLILSALGAVAGLLVAHWASRFLVRQLSNDAVSLDLTVDWPVLAFTAGITIITALVFGLGPALQASRGAPLTALKDAGRGSSGSGRTRLAGGLVVAQVVLSLVLLVGAGLFLRTFTSLTTVSLGFDSDRVLLAQVTTRRAEVAPQHRLDTFERIRQRVRAVPGVAADGLSLIAPLSGRMWCRQVEVSGSAMPKDERNSFASGIGFTSATMTSSEPYTALNAVTPGWMATFGLSVRAGRDIDETDAAGAPRIAVVNEAFVRKFLPGQNAIGHTMRVVLPGGTVARPPREIVGVVTDAVYRNLREQVLPTAYVPLAQYDADASDLPPLDIILSVRAASGHPVQLKKAVADAVTDVNPRLALVFRPLADQVSRTMVQERLLAMLSGFFGALAVVLAAIGLYGVTSYAVGLRKAEIGVRLALGATRGGVMRLVLGKVARLVGAGTAIGLVLSLFATRYVKTLLFGLEPSDPMTFVASTILLGAVSLAAGWIPANRASRLDVAGLLNRN
jgi:putative ABC transport system permease protein